MRHTSALFLVTAAMLFALSCEQNTVDLSEATNPAPWIPIDEFEGHQTVTDVWGSGANDVYAGYQDYNGSQVLRHFDGSSWSVVKHGPDANYIGSIWGSGPDDVYAAASASLWHYDGHDWRDTGVRAQKVSGSSRDNVMATDGRHLFRFDGAAWDTLLTPANAYVRSFWIGAGPSAIVYLDPYNYTVPDSLLRLNNGAWSAPEPVPGRWISQFAGPAADDVTAVGADSVGGMAWHWNGAQWTPTMTSDQWPPLNDVAMVAPGDLYAAARDAVLHFDGNAWQSLNATGDKYYEDVWASGPSDVYVAGEELNHFDGSVWKPAIRITPDSPRVAWADTRGRVVLGSNGAVYRWENGEWRKEDIGPGRTVYAIEGSAWDDLYAATDGGVYHSDGAVWTLMPDSPGYIDAMSVVPSGEIFASAGGTFYSFDAKGWTKIKEVSVSGSEAVWAFDAQHVLFGYPDGIWRMENSSWTRISADRCTSIWAVSSHDIYAVIRGFIQHSEGGVFVQVGPVIPGGAEEIVGTSADHIIATGHLGYAEWRDGHWIARANPENWFPLDAAAARDGSIVQLEVSSRSRGYRLSYVHD